ncbi:YceI family protein [Kribbella sp. NBC_01484]|uniref:YceI family protein n=1 Tax=Kribbella sp. NBC_01484 TaxID=2903579 RepID=UPI002E36F7E5|nr:YceI family protein [Kribbella sp. NBC_01484]
MSNEYAALSGDYTIDTAHSRVGFVARHAMVTKVRGSFDEFEGSIHIDGETPEKSSGKVTIQAKSINTRNSQRDDHLRSNDFLDMDNQPEITFASTGIRQTGDAEFVVSGDLSIRGVTKPVEIAFEYTGTATDPFGNERVGLEGSVVINRKDFGVSWNAALEGGGVLVSEKVTLEIEVSAIKNG